MWNSSDSEEDSSHSDSPSQEEEEVEQTSNDIRVCSAFDFPKARWNEHRRVFNLLQDKGYLHGSAQSKIDLFKDRYHMVLQRLKRTIFANPKDNLQLSTVDALIGSPGRKLVVGMLTQLREGVYYLEDPNGQVPIALDRAMFGAGMFTQGSIVLAEGSYSDAEGVFHVDVLLQPPSEGREKSKQFLGNVDLFMPPIVKTVSAKYSKLFGDVVEDAMDVVVPSNAEIVILAEVHLDSLEVMLKLRELFSSYEEEPPSMFVLMGNFSSSLSALADNVQQLREGFEKLARLVAGYPAIARTSHFVFVPGPTDPGGEVVNILPKHPLPKVFTEPFRARVAHSHFVTNPARIRFYGLDFVVFRQNLVNKMFRRCIRDPQDDEDINVLPQHLVKTIADQAHLSPLTLPVQPIYWNFDHALSLYPLPHVVMLGDKYDQFEHTYDDCLFINTGSFTTDYSFMVYRPSESPDSQVEFSRIDDK